jgi:hypothetical protein
MSRKEPSTPGTAPACVASSDRGSLVVRRGCGAGIIQPRRYFIRTCIYLKDLSDPMRNLCLFVHDCLFDRKSIQRVVLFGRIRRRDHPCILALIDPRGPKLLRCSLAIPLRKFCEKIHRPNFVVWKNILCWEILDPRRGL